MADKYADNLNLLEVNAKLSQCATMKEVLDLANSTYPGWILGCYDRYCDDYPSMTENWHTICEAAGTRPAQIMIVDNMSFGEEFSLIQKFGNIFTAAGFAVRRKADLIPCSVCEAMIPVRFWHERLKVGGKTVPSTWSRNCIGCQVVPQAQPASQQVQQPG